MPTIKTEAVHYSADGLSMVGDLYWDASRPGPFPAVLVFPDAYGLDGFAREKAERLAELGYAALACDLHGNGFKAESFEEVTALIGAFAGDQSRIRERAAAPFHQLRQDKRVDPRKIAAIGYCFGGTMALELARSGEELAGLVGFHSGLATANPADARNIKGKVLVCLGERDPVVPAEQRAAFESEMREAGVDWQMQLYGGVWHSFTNPEAHKIGRPETTRYDARADARSWASMRVFLEEVFG